MSSSLVFGFSLRLKQSFQNSPDIFSQIEIWNLRMPFKTITKNKIHIYIYQQIKLDQCRGGVMLPNCFLHTYVRGCSAKIEILCWILRWQCPRCRTCVHICKLSCKFQVMVTCPGPRHVLVTCTVAREGILHTHCFVV